MLRLLILSFVILCLSSCEEDPVIKEPIEVNCSEIVDFENQNSRSFKMGFTSWPYEFSSESSDDTYNFIKSNGDILTEHFDNYIPWKSLLSAGSLPKEFTDEIVYKSNQLEANIDMMLSISFLSGLRDGIAIDEDGDIPDFDNWSDESVYNAYSKHLIYMIEQFKPTHLVFGVEVNELYNKDQNRWQEYTQLANRIRNFLKENYPDILVSESITLHNLIANNLNEDYISDVITHTQQNDFTSVSFYPFLSGLSSIEEFQSAFDRLHELVNKPIAFVETGHIAEDLVNDFYNLNIASAPCEQRDYLKVLLQNAFVNDYLFVTWYAHRDYDALWEQFPASIKDIGQLWRDTGLLDEAGNKRPSYTLWKQIFNLRN